MSQSFNHFSSIRRIALLGCGVATVGLAAAAAQAGTGGDVNANGTINWSANFRFPPTAADTTEFQRQVTEASQIMWDATEGQLRFGTVTTTCGARNEDAADMWLFPQRGRAGVSFSNDGSNLQRPGAHITQFMPDSTAFVVAHEMGHHALGLADEYDEQPRHIGRCIEPANLTEQQHCLMQGEGAVSQTEFCLPANHDPNQGEGLPCTPGAAPTPGDCQFYDPTTSRYEATQQSMINGHSCWSRMDQNFPFLTPPAGLPTAAAPAGFVAPNFVDQCTASTTVMLVLDRSGSMAWHPDNDRGEVCANGVDEDGDGVTDETDTAGGCAEPRINYLRAAARGYVALANGRSQRVGIVSFSNLATQDVPLQLVDTASLTTFDTAVNNLMPAGNTAIGRALSSTATILAGETDATKTAFLISDGHNTEGEAPESVVSALTQQGIRVFTISVGDASNDPTLGGIASMTRGSPLDSRDARTLVNAFVQQFSRASNDGMLIPLLPYEVNAAGPLPGPDFPGVPVASPQSWVHGQTDIPDDGLAPPHNIFSFIAEEGTERITIALAGNMDDMRQFGMRAALSGPPGPGPTSLDSTAPDPSMKVTSDGYFELIEINAPNPGQWTLWVSPEQGAAPVQSGHLTIVTENPRVDLFTSLDRYVVNDVTQPVRLRITPYYFTELSGLDQLTATVKLPDGSVEPLQLVANPNSSSAEPYEAVITNMPHAGTYEVRVYMRTGPATRNDPGETLFAAAPDNSVTVPLLERTRVETFSVVSANFPCLESPNDCDGDGLLESKDEDADGDGIPNDFDNDADNDEIPDVVETPQGELIDTDGDGVPDYLDSDSDDDTGPDTQRGCSCKRSGALSVFPLAVLLLVRRRRLKSRTSA